MDGVHFEVARDWNKTRNYARKVDTAIPGTQVKWEIDQTSIVPLNEALIAIAEKAIEFDLKGRLEQQLKEQDEYMREHKVVMQIDSVDKLIKEEFW